ncbi:MAG TPA: hypothetical protein VNU72_01380 [Puia sp.]|nr:hypothetical protein [Puia sp.]
MESHKLRPHPLASGLIGIILLLPASYFMLTLLVRICVGVKSPYYFIAPSFLQTRFDPFAWHKAQFIMGTLMLSILINALTIFRFRLLPARKGLHKTGIAGIFGPHEIGISYRPNGLNTAIVLQGFILFLVLLTYTLVQHIRY